MSKHILLNMYGGQLLNDFQAVARIFMTVAAMITFITSLVDIKFFLIVQIWSAIFIIIRNSTFHREGSIINKKPA